MAFEFLKKLFCKKEEAGQQKEQTEDTQSDVSGSKMDAGQEAASGAETSSEKEEQQ